jgi:hypothetical protein
MAASVRPCVVCGKNTNRWFMNPEGDYGDHPAHPKCEPKHQAAYAATQARIAEVVAVVTAWENEAWIGRATVEDRRKWAALYVAEHEGEAG